MGIGQAVKRARLVKFRFDFCAIYAQATFAGCSIDAICKSRLCILHYFYTKYCSDGTNTNRGKTKPSLNFATEKSICDIFS